MAVAHQFWKTLDALREMHRSMSAVVGDLDTKRLTWEEVVAVQGLTPEKQQKLVDYISELEEERRLEEEAEIENGEPRSEDDQLTISDRDREILGSIFGSDGEKAALARIGLKARMLNIVPERRWFLNGALLTMAIGALEVLVGGIRARRHDLYPGTLSTDKKEFSLDDLRRYESLAEAEEDAIAKEVEDFLRQEGFAQWMEWYNQTTGLSCQDYAMDFAALEEAFQRRHLIVHNAGRVSRRYRSYQGSVEEEPEVGQRLPVDDSYLVSTFEQLDAFGTLILIGAYSKWEPDEEETAYVWLVEHCYESMLAGRWPVAKKLASYGKLLRHPAEASKHVFQVNEWLAFKRLGEFEVVKSDVEAWDTSALGLGFRTAQAALLGDNMDRTFELVIEAVRADELGETSLIEWPLFEELREDERFLPLLELARATPDDSRIVLPAAGAKAPKKLGDADHRRTS